MRRALVFLAVLCPIAATAGWEAERRLKRRSEVEQLVGQIASGRDVQAAISKIAFLDEPDYAARRLVERLQGEVEDPARRDLAMALAQIKARMAEPVLIELTRDRDASVRMSAAQGLGRLRSRAAEPLLPLLSDSSMAVRREAAKALGYTGEERAGKILIDVARREVEPEVRAAMLAAAGGAGDRRQVPALEGFLRHSSESARYAAAQGLCRLGASRGLAFVSLRLASEDRSERRRALDLLEEVPLKVAGPLLRPLLSDKDPALAASSARLLHLAGEKKMLEWLVVGSFQATGEAKLAFEDQLELLHLTDEQRAKILVAAGLVKRVSR